MYKIHLKPEVDKAFKKIARKNKNQLKIVHKKILEIQNDPNHKYKFLRKPLQNINRVHIDKHFVLLFKINHKKKYVEIQLYKHHDEIYK